jgi:hypothetical protein
MNQLKEGPIGFVVVQVNGRTPEEVCHRMGVVCESAAMANAVVDCLFSGFVIASVGTIPGAASHPEKEIQRVVDAIRKTEPDSLRMVWGVHHGVFGTMGGPTRFAYSFIVPDFMDAFTGLVKLAFGQVSRI